MIKRVQIALAVVALALTAGCGGGGGNPLDETSSAGGAGKDTITIGSANFLENVLLGEIYAQGLETAGFTVEKKLNIGSREIIYNQVEKGTLDVVPEYNGALLSFVAPDDTSSTEADVNAALKAKLPTDLIILESSPAQDRNTVVVTKETAAAHNLKTLADLQPVAGTMVFGGAPEDRTRYQGMKGLEEVYKLNFKEFKALDQAGPLTITALQDGDVQAGILYSTTPEIAERGFVALDDPENLFGVQNVTPLVNSTTVNAEAQAVLNSISQKMDTDTLTALNARVQIKHEDPAVVAKSWLSENGLG